VTKRRSHARKGRVIAQSPKRGAVRKNGAKVRVVLSRGR
jgi:beta-lactam-binding protein with PASTA domain